MRDSNTSDVLSGSCRSKIEFQCHNSADVKMLGGSAIVGAARAGAGGRGARAGAGGAAAVSPGRRGDRTCRARAVTE